MNNIVLKDENLDREVDITNTPSSAAACSYAHNTHLCECSDPTQWKEIRDHPGYFLCCDGNVVSCKYPTRPRFLKPYYNHGCLSHSFGKRTKGTAKLVLEHFHPTFLETGGHILYCDKNRRNVKLSNLNFEPFEELGSKAFWDVYHKTRWDRNDTPEECVRTYFDHILDSESVENFCVRYNAGDVPQKEELKQILEHGWIEKYGLRRFFNQTIPVGQIHQMLNYLIARATQTTQEDPPEPSEKRLKL